MTKTVLFAVGGTGGHLFPALSAADALKKIDPSLSILFAGGGLKQQQSFENVPYPYHLIAAAPLSFRHPFKLMKNLFTMAKGVRESCQLFDSHTVSMVVGFGSYYSLPLLLAARWKNIPYILHEQNTIPGRVIRLFSEGALFTGIHFPEAEKHLKGKCRIVGMPLRKAFIKENILKSEALKYFSLDPNKTTLLVFGGSQGASGINNLFAEGVTAVSYQILHFTGSSKETERFQKMYQAKGIVSCVKDYEQKMELAWAAADCALCRAGASSIAEQIEFEVPGVLVPYPFAMDNHQEFNADFFVKEVGGGVKFLESQKTGLLDVVTKVMEPKEVGSFRQNISHYKKQINTQNFASEIFKSL